MSEIKVGDLVVVVKPQPCCGSSRAIGRIHTVHGIARTPFTCTECWTSGVDDLVLYGDFSGTSISCVRKIEPLEDPETIEIDDSLDTEVAAILAALDWYDDPIPRPVP